MNMARQVRLFQNGRNQAIRIPRDMELPPGEAWIRKEGDRLIIEPATKPGLLQLLDSWEPLEMDFPEVTDLPARPVDL